METLIKVASTSLSGMIDGAINKIGMTSFLTAIGINAADQAGAIELASSVSDTWGAFDWLGLLAGIGTATFIIKNLLDARKTYLEIKLIKLKEHPDKVDKHSN